jgi:hypothetical protein
MSTNGLRNAAVYSERQTQYLQKAFEADECAAKAKYLTERDAWLKIAEGYRALARKPP